MKQALGLVEIEGLSTAVVAADAMAKAANVRILGIENAKGMGYITIKAVGDVGAVNASVSAGKQVGVMHGKLVSFKVIARPAEYVEQCFCTPPEDPKPETIPESVMESDVNVPDVTELDVEKPDELEPDQEQPEQPPAQKKSSKTKKVSPPNTEREPES